MLLRTYTRKKQTTGPHCGHKEGFQFFFLLKEKMTPFGPLEQRSLGPNSSY